MSVERTRPGFEANERDMLNSWLDYHRATLLQKIEGLSEEDARRRAVATSTLTLLSLIKHLAYVERWWFQAHFQTAELDFPENDDDFKIESSDTVANIVALYRVECEKSRQIIQTNDLDTTGINPENQKEYSLRWVIGHMIEETARHNGHADLIREAIDGVTGV